MNHAADPAKFQIAAQEMVCNPSILRWSSTGKQLNLASIMTLNVSGRIASTIFGLHGADESSATSALGWAFDQSSRLRSAFLEAALGKPVDVADSLITLKKHGKDSGYTDLEIQAGLQYHIILEAKRYWDVPSIPQLERAVGR